MSFIVEGGCWELEKNVSVFESWKNDNEDYKCKYNLLYIYNNKELIAKI